MRAHLPQSRAIVFHGIGRVRISCSVFTATSRTARRSTSELESGSVSYLTVHLRPQQRPGPVNTAFQRAYRTAGRHSGFFITLLLKPDQMKGFFLFLRQALVGHVELAYTGAFFLRGTYTNLGRLVEVVMLTLVAYA